MSSNQLILDNEIVDVHIKKVFGLSDVAKSNSYTELSNIPEKFNPEEHTSSHPIVNDTMDGLINLDMKTKIKNLASFNTLKVIYNVEPQDINKGYKNLNISLTLSELNISSDTMSEFDVNSIDKIIKIIGTSLDPNIYKPVQGDKGDKGEIGNNGYWWKPLIDSEGFISWELIKTNVDDGFTINIVGMDGDIGHKGYNGSNAFFDNVLNNVYTNNYTLRLKGQMVQFVKTNNPNDLNFYKSFKMLNDNMSIISKKFQLNYYKNIYTDTIPEYLYCIQDNNFYKYNFDLKDYSITDDYSFNTIFTYNSFIYDRILDNFMYISSNKRFIGV